MVSTSVLYVLAFSALASAVPSTYTSCSVWSDVLTDIQANLFDGGKCGDDAHDALRLVFHDSIGFSEALGESGGGGADGSIIAFSNIELNYPSNVGLTSIVEKERTFADKHGVSYGDMIQFAAAVSVGNCKSGPRISFLAGRPNATQAAQNGLVPNPFDSADKIIARMADAGFTSDELVALLASHSVAAQEDVDPTIPGTPFDTTPEDFDSQFFLETLLDGVLYPGNGSHLGEAKSPLKKEFRLQSDFELARDPRTACTWTSYILYPALMIQKFKAAMEKLAVVGQNTATLTDCSSVIPTADGIVPPPAQFPDGKTFFDFDISCKWYPPPP